MELSSQYTLTLAVEGGQMTVVQHLVVWTSIRNFVTSASGNIVDVALTDTYALDIDADGRIVGKLSASGPPVNNSRTPGVDGFLNFFGPVDKLAADFPLTRSTSSGESVHDADREDP